MRWQITAMFTMLLSACSDHHIIVDPVAQTGGLAITFVTTGDFPDPDGYALSIDNATSIGIGINGSSIQAELEPGDHHIAVLGLASNCTLAGDNPRTAAVMAGDTTSVTFEVSCLTPPCGIQAATKGTTRQDRAPSLSPDWQKLAAGCARHSPTSIRL